MNDLLIIGGGVIGLSLAYDLSGRGMKILLLDQGEPGRESSWAGAGILPPGNPLPHQHPHELLAGHSSILHPQWAAQLREETGVDTGYRQCGGYYLSHDKSSNFHSAAADLPSYWRSRGIRFQPLTATQLAAQEPSLRISPTDETAAWFLPDEAQLRNPRHLKALILACAKRGVEIVAGAAVHDFELSANKIQAVLSSRGRFSAEKYALCGGAWSGMIARRLGLELSIRPIRGQIVLLNVARPLLNSIVNVGSRYFVPRFDGRILIGSTEEEAGFDKSSPAESISELLQFALAWVPDLKQASCERYWAGLRPGTSDGLPYLGHMPTYENGYVAAGHFRSGLQLSPATALVMGQVIRGEKPSVNLSPFRMDRTTK